VDRLEQSLRDVLTGARTELEATPEAVAAVHTGVRRRRRRRQAMTAVAGVAVLAIAGTGGMALVSHQRDTGHVSIASGPRWSLGSPVTLPAQAGTVTSMSAYGGVLWLSTSNRQVLRV
jgi:hypothetical protein